MSVSKILTAVLLTGCLFGCRSTGETTLLTATMPDGFDPEDSSTFPQKVEWKEITDPVEKYRLLKEHESVKASGASGGSILRPVSPNSDDTPASDAL